MPELPEVETVRNVLKKKVLNKKIKNVNVFYEKMIENDIDFFKNTLKNNEFLDIDRKGKYLIFELNNYFLISHLRMEGKFFYKDKKETINKHEHVEIEFLDNSVLIYHDTRKFGKMKLIEKQQLNKYFEKLGPEPKDADINYLYEKISRSNKFIKTILLDQSVIAGLGNIYANEVLFKAKINPFKKGKEITKLEAKNIIEASSEILDKSIKNGGCTIKSYTSSLGVTGNYQNYLLVHMRENEPCKGCKSKILKTKIDGRSTYYCEYCQK